jgi:DNA-binding NtrC family response regulator
MADESRKRLPTGEGRADRIQPRIPFFSPVIASRLHRAWATNLSAGGIGLTAQIPGDQPPVRGDDLELGFVLGEQRLRTVGRVAWTSLVRPGGRFGLGVEFRDLSRFDRAALALFLANHRPRIVVALADRDARAMAEGALAHYHVEFVDDPIEIGADLLRSCASIAVMSNDPDRITALLVAIHDHQPEASWFPGDAPPAPVILCTDVVPDRLMPLFIDGAIHGVLRPPFDGHTLALAVDRSCEQWTLQSELRWASLQIEGFARSQNPAGTPTDVGAPRTSSDPDIVCESTAMRRVYELVGTVAAHDVPVLLIGETGTGKELAAREIHARSRRASTPFVTQDCGALTETLLESELFGHVRGAFTGATTDNPGLFQIADGGTIFLDEIQNTSPALQAKLLRVVEVGEVRPVGSAKVRRVDVRLIAACNVDLRQAVKEQRFRSDFFYRLNRFPIDIPPLRDHPDDVLPLARRFLAVACTNLGRAASRIDPRAEAALVGYPWPGNVRELKNAIERALLLTYDGDPIRWNVLPDELRITSEFPAMDDDGSLQTRVDDYERRLIGEALARHGGVIRRAARELQVNPITLSRKMRRLGMS